MASDRVGDCSLSPGELVRGQGQAADDRTREIAEYLRTELNAPWYAQLIEGAFLDGAFDELEWP